MSVNGSVAAQSGKATRKGAVLTKASPSHSPAGSISPLLRWPAGRGSRASWVYSGDGDASVPEPK